MAIDRLGQISNEQLMAMSLMSNGQLTNELTSSTSDETNYAFQLMMQDYLDSSKKSVEENVEKVTNGDINNKNINNVAFNESIEDKDFSKEDLTGIIATANSNGISRQVQQKYGAGQRLLDIPLVVNGNIVEGEYSSYSPSNASRAELDKIYSAVNKAAKRYGINENLILAVIKQESDFDSTTTSSVGASGLMQIMPDNFSHLGITDGYDVEQNVDGGTKLLKEYLNQYNGDIQMALMAYNGGPGTMQKRGVTSSSDLYKMPSETQHYVPKVMGYYKNGV